jgi:HPt (histidine-containing phosphotransfer) domain-containing protein
VPQRSSSVQLGSSCALVRTLPLVLFLPIALSGLQLSSSAQPLTSSDVFLDLSSAQALCGYFRLTSPVPRLPRLSDLLAGPHDSVVAAVHLTLQRNSPWLFPLILSGITPPSILHIWPTFGTSARHPLTASAAHLYCKYKLSNPALSCLNQNPQKKEQSSILPQIEHLLTEQTSAILEALDAKLSAQDRRINEGFAAQDKRLEEKFVAQDIRLLAAVDKRFQKMEERFAKSLDELTKTLDKFLKRLSDIEEEFVFMKEDLKRVKAVLREKLGVSLD